MNGVSISVGKAGYPVTGASREEVLRSIEKNGPERKGERYAAYTDWEISWDFRLRPSSKRGFFHVTDPSVKVRAFVVMPEWKAPPNAPGSLREKWHRARTAIERHEAEHVAFALKSGDRVLQRLKSLGPLPSEDRSVIDTILKAEIGKIQLDERQHDKLTRHGVTQGTAL